MAVAAAVLQIAQLAGVVALKTTNISKRLKHAQQVIDSNLRFVNDFTCIFYALKSALEIDSGDSSCIRDVLSDESRTSIEELLRRCDEQANSCGEILRSIVPQDKNKLRETWKRVMSIKIEEEINQRLKNLDSLRLQLSIWYSHQIMLSNCRVNLRLKIIDNRL